MIIPVCCFTCGQIVADKWEYFQRELAAEKARLGVPAKHDVYIEGDSIVVAGSKNVQTPEGKILDHLGLHKYCCRRMLLAHVDTMITIGGN